MGSDFYDFLYQGHVILQVVLLMGVQHIAAITNGRLNDTAGILHCLDTNFELVDVIQSIKNPKNVDAIFLCLLTEMVDGIIR